MDREPNSLFVFFGEELRRRRNAAGLSQEALGKKIGFSAEQVGKVENCDRRPTLRFAQSCDDAFPDAQGMFTNLVEAAEKSAGVYPAWFASWVDAEQRASVLRFWAPLIIPGLLQTADYARAIFEAWQAIDGGDVDADVSARLARQAVLDRPLPPSLQVVLDEAVLHRCVGGTKVMHDQLLHLAQMSERSRITVQVIPADIGVHVGLLGAFAVASFGDDTPGIVYLESPDEGETTKHPVTVGKIGLTFDALRADALGARASRDLIMKVAEE